MGDRPSWAWSSILKGRDIIQLGARWNVGNGQDILIYQDKWVPTLPGFKVLTRISLMIKEYSPPTTKDLLVPPPKPRAPDKPQQSSWSRPPQDFIKINVDATYVPDSGSAALAMIARNSNGQICFGNSWLCVALSPLMAEALAMLRAIKSAINRGLHAVIFESDNQALISYIQQHEKLLPWEVKPVIMNISQACSCHPDFLFNYVPRKGNRVADWVAKSSLKGKCPWYWAHRPPNLLSFLLLVDSMNT
ncbi:hypothetical protein SLE2022_364950 [Rubroshorea leprosula]